MNEEQAKRLADAADAILQAGDALDEAREAIADKRFDGDIERDRIAAAQQMTAKLDAASKKIQDALRKSAIAAAAASRAGAYVRYRAALTATREGRVLARTAGDQEGTANKRARGEEAASKFDEAINAAAALTFAD